MNWIIAEYAGTAHEDDGVVSLLAHVYVDAGFTDSLIAEKLFTPSEVKSRGLMILATLPAGNVVGLVILGSQDNPYRQVAGGDEAEMQLLAVDPSVRGQGLGRALCVEFEQKAHALGYRAAVLSTQPCMDSAHRLYESLGYRRTPTRDWVRADRAFLVYQKALHNGPARSSS